MGCFLGCFGGEKDRRRRKQRGNRGSPQRQRNGVQNVHQQEVTAEQSIKGTNSNLDSELLRNKLEELEQLRLTPKTEISLNSNVTTHDHIPVQPSVEFQPKNAIITDEAKQHDLKISSPPDGDDNSVSSSVKSYPSNLKNKTPKGSEQSSPSPRKRVTFNSNVTTYEHVSIHESGDFQKDDTMEDDITTPTRSYSVPEDENSVTSSVASYPPNHRYHNVRDSDDEAEEYGDSDLDDMDDDDEDEDYYDDYDEDIGVRAAGQEVWSESLLPAASMESRTGSHSPQDMNEEAESSMLDAFCSKANARDRSNYINSVLNPVGNTTQWKAAKSRVQQHQHLLKPQKENLVANFSFEPTFGQQPSKAAKSDQAKNANQDIAVDASLSTWLSSLEVTPSKKTTNHGGLETFKPGSEESCTVMSFEDRPILGALTVEELRQMSKSASPRKSPSRSPDEMPIIGTVGTYWNHLNSSNKHSDSSYKGIPNTTSKYREDKKVNWHSTPFEKRLDRAISRGGNEA